MKRAVWLALLVGLVGCAKQPAELEPNLAQIRIISGIEESVSRAVATSSTGLTGARFLKKDSVALPKSFSGITPVVGNVNAETGEVNFAVGSEPTYKLDDTKAWLVGYYPAGTLASGKVSWTVDGQTDVLATDAVYDAGKYTASNTGASGTKLQFNHQLAQIEVVCKAAAAGSLSMVRTSWGKIKSIELIDNPTTLAYTLNGLTVAAGATKSDRALLASYTGTAFAAIDIPASTNAAVNACAMVVPVAATATESFSLRITTEGPTSAVADDLVFPLSVDLGGSLGALSKGKRHQVTITFQADGKAIDLLSTSIEAWGTGTNGTTEMAKTAIMTYGDLPYSSTTGLSGSTTTSYNGWVGTVADGGNGAYQATQAVAVANEKPYYKLEVALEDEPTKMVWQAAREACWAKTTNGGGWRLPRGTEHRWIVANATELAKVAGFVAMVANNYYATATEVDKDRYMISYSSPTGSMTPNTKTSSAMRVRCVREWPITPIGGVKVGSLYWATGNLVASGNNSCKIGAPTDYGVYFQFGSLVGWTGGATGNGVGTGSPTLDKAVWPAAMGATKPTYTWQNVNADGTATLANYYFNYAVAPWNASGSASADIGTFDKTVTGQGATTGTLRGGRYANLGVGDPCTYYLGAPWRTPTTAEYLSLFAGVANGTAWSAVPGWNWQATPPGAMGSVFFPASGRRDSSNGSFNDVTTRGGYWSSSVTSATNSFYLFFHNSWGGYPQNNSTRSYGSPVRCVADL